MTIRGALAALLLATPAAADVSLLPPPFIGGSLSVQTDILYPGTTGFGLRVRSPNIAFPWDATTDAALQVQGGFSVVPRSGTASRYVQIVTESPFGGHFDGPGILLGRTDIAGGNVSFAYHENSIVRMQRNGSGIPFQFSAWSAVQSLVPFGAQGSFSGSALTAINTGTGNAIEAYTGTGSVGMLVSAAGGFPGPGISSLPYSNDSAVPFGQYIGLYAAGGFSQLQNGNDFAGVHFGVNNTTERGAVVYHNGFNLVGFCSSTGTFGFASGTENGVATGTHIERGINTHLSTVNAGAGGKWTWQLRSMTGDTARSAYEWQFRNFNNNLQAIHTSWSKVDDTTQAVTRLVDMTYAGELVPTADNTGALGTATNRWASVRAVTVTTGDLGFEDEACPVCAREFAQGDDVVWRIRKREAKVSYAVPVHVACLK